MRESEKERDKSLHDLHVYVYFHEGMCCIQPNLMKYNTILTIAQMEYTFTAVFYGLTNNICHFNCRFVCIQRSMLEIHIQTRVYVTIETKILNGYGT